MSENKEEINLETVKNETIIEPNRFNLWKNFLHEKKYLFLVWLGLYIILQAVYYRESIVSILRISLSIYFISIVAGFPWMYFWYEKIDFLERVIIGSVLGLALSGVTIYYLSFLGLGPKITAWIVPLLLGILGLFSVFFYRKKRVK